MADVKWIKITTDVFDDEKILLIESMPDANAIIVVWFKLLCLAGKQNNHGVFLMNDKIPYTDKMLSTIFRMNEATVQLALKTFEQFGMIDIIDGVITIPNWNKHQSLDSYEKKKERDRLYQAERRDKQRRIATKSSDSKTTQSSDVAISEEDKEKNKKKKKDNINTFNEVCGECFFSSSALEEKIMEWLEYKNERKEYYVERGIKTLVTQINKNCTQYGDDAVIELIDKSMANNYAGIIFDKLVKGKPQPKQSSYQEQVNNRMSVVDNW